MAKKRTASILLVDDHHTLKLLTKILSPLGYQLFTAASGEEADRQPTS